MENMITKGQENQIFRLAEDGINAAKLNKDEAQRVIERGDEFQTHIIAGIRELSVSDQFADEEVRSNYGYLSGYKPKGITEQTNILRQFIPGVGFAEEKIAGQPLPPNAEGWFAIPRWEKIAPTYSEAVQKVFDLIKQTRNGKFYNFREGQLGSRYLRQSAKTAQIFQMLGDQQKNHDILVIAAQFGLRHRGRSVRRAREVMNASEFGLGAFAVGIMLLTHPERLQQYDDLWIDCAGDEFAPYADGVFYGAPFFHFRGDRVWFGTHFVGHARECYGSASAFLPQ